MPVSIIVGAYGPGRATREAVRRAKALVGPRDKVVVFAALRPGVEAVARCDVPGVTRVEGIGSRALLAALAEVPEGPVLFVHDDVLVTKQALRALLAAYGTGSYVVPYSNDIGMDHFCGPLPEVRNARNRVAERARALTEGDPKPKLVRPSCVLADRGDMAQLVRSHVADPRLQLDVISLDVRVAAGAVVAHDSTCTRRFTRPEELDADRPLVVAAMIVKNEEEMLPGALESFWPLCDEIVVCDTGSTDRTVEIAESMGATVIHREWRNDFGWARSEAVERAAHGWWILSVDADDRFVCEDPQMVRKMLASYIDEYDAFGGLTENRTQGLDGWLSTAFEGPRIYRGGLFEFVGHVHEVLVDKEHGAPPFAPRMDHFKIVHLGYEAQVMTDKNKADRNFDLARASYERDPSAKHAMEYARSIKLAGGDRRQAYELMAGVVEEMEERGARQDPAHARSFSYILTFMSEEMIALGDAEKALEHARGALSLVPADDLAASAFAQAALAAGAPEELIEMEEKRARERSLRPLFRSDGAHSNVLSLKAAAYIHTGDIDNGVEAAAEALRLAPDGFAIWELMVASLCDGPADGMGKLVELTLLDPTGAFFSAIVGKRPTAFTANFCLAYCRRGGTLAEAVRVGLTAALVAGESEVFEGLAAYAHMIDDDTRRAIAGRAEARGRADFAAALMGETIAAG